MTPEISRRRALGLLGGLGVGAAVIGACSDDTTSGTSASGDRSSTTATTGGGGTSTTSAGGTAPGAVTADAFEGAAACTVTPQQTEGPYYLDVDRIRSDIREDREGTQLRVAARVLDVDGCTPVKDAVFEIWHCDAGGLYSGFETASQGGGRGPGGGPGGGSSGASDDKRYLRGAQVTNADGIAEIITIYPGWYQGRSVHIHAKVQFSNTDALTTQLYFDDELSDMVFAAAPYSARSGARTLNTDDGIYRQETTLTVSQDGSGYLGLITIGIS